MNRGVFIYFRSYEGSQKRIKQHLAHLVIALVIIKDRTMAIL